MDFEERHKELETELKKGAQALIDLGNKQKALRDQLLQIRGALTLLEEMQNHGTKSIQSIPNEG